ncbi:DUF3850 domain-containing protein [Leuconostoc falkenbergense]|uniref:DUF3850 domain-containing protein n=1 Tax=Leuconostoc falkenbergense TaxID=2766470 RepID=UPI0021AA4899|nr:DUF3850 domain-containing protein [Leuconostoc falkenbergense]MCT4420249.1 DUF3850 domain-containing protein [Leuconostoc falkenbergense]
MMKIHELKLDTFYFDDVKNRLKTFEIRKNDRDYQVGDLLSLSRFEDGKYLKTKSGFYSNKENGLKAAILNEADTILMVVTYITDYEQKDGYVVMGIEPYAQVTVKDD